MTRGAVADALWAAVLVAGFALGFGGWPSRGATWLAFAQALPVVVGAVALAHAASLTQVVVVPRRERLMLLLLPPVGALLLGALLAGGDALVRPLVRVAAFALYRRRDPDPPAEVADVFHLGAAVVLAPLLVLVFVLALRLVVRLLAPSLREAAGRTLGAHLAACVWVPLLVLGAVGVAPASRAIAAVLAAAVAAALLGLLARRSIVGEGAVVTAPVIAMGAAGFAIIGYLAGGWAALP